MTKETELVLVCPDDDNLMALVALSIRAELARGNVRISDAQAERCADAALRVRVPALSELWAAYQRLDAACAQLRRWSVKGMQPEFVKEWNEMWKASEAVMAARIRTAQSAIEEKR